LLAFLRCSSSYASTFSLTLGFLTGFTLYFLGGVFLTAFFDSLALSFSSFIFYFNGFLSSSVSLAFSSALVVMLTPIDGSSFKALTADGPISFLTSSTALSFWF
jgi:hypothetical protein